MMFTRFKTSDPERSEPLPIHFMNSADTACARHAGEPTVIVKAVRPAEKTRSQSAPVPDAEVLFAAAAATWKAFRAKLKAEVN